MEEDKFVEQIKANGGYPITQIGQVWIVGIDGAIEAKEGGLVNVGMAQLNERLIVVMNTQSLQNHYDETTIGAFHCAVMASRFWQYSVQEVLQLMYQRPVLWLKYATDTDKDLVKFVPKNKLISALKWLFNNERKLKCNRAQSWIEKCSTYLSFWIRLGSIRRAK